MRVLFPLTTMFFATTLNAQLVNTDPIFSGDGIATLTFPDQIASTEPTACVLPLNNKQLIVGCITSMRPGVGAIPRLHFKL